MIILDKIAHYMLRAEIFMMGFREAYIPGVWPALKRRGIDINKVKVYKRNMLVMVLYKNRTLIFDIYDWIIQEGFYYDKTAKDFIDYVYEQLEPENWE